MDQDLYNIAKHNLKIRKKAAWVAFIGVSIFTGLLLYTALSESEQIWPVFIMVPLVVSMLWYVFHQERKIIGKKNAVEREMDKLKEAGVTNEDIEPLKLKQIVKEFRDDELV